MALTPKFILSTFGFSIAGKIFRVDAPETDAVIGTSDLDTPIFDNVLLYQADDEEHFRIDTVMIDLSMQKHIVKTVIDGRPGTVKEFFADGDYRVILRGGIHSNMANVMPVEQIAELMRLLKLPNEIEVVSGYLQLFDIYSLVIESYRFPQKEGMRDTLLFDITAISETPYELIEEDQDV